MINRRQLLFNSTLGFVAAQLPLRAFAEQKTQKAMEPKVSNLTTQSSAWKSYSLKMRVAPSAPIEGLLLPLPMQQDTTYQRSLDLSISGNFSKADAIRDAEYRADALKVTFEKTTQKPVVEVQMTIQTRDRSAPEPKSAAEDVTTYLKPTTHMPVDGLVKEFALKIAGSAKSTDEKALAFHNWIVDNTFRDPKVQGCGIGDINALLKSGQFGGKCADLNALFVGFCRAAGIPAREVFGLRVGESAQFKSIGKTGMISKAQHCRAEYFSENKGWVAVDPADVRKIILEEKLEINDPKVQAVRKKLFGFWEMNWMAYNSARDIRFPGVEQELNFLMYPQSVGGTLNPLDPDQFTYTIETVA